MSRTPDRANERPNPDTDARLRRLERSNRLLASGLLVVLVVGVWGVGRSEPVVTDVLRARRIQLVDVEDRARAELGIDKDGSAGLFVFDPEGRTRASVTHDPDQTALYLIDGDGAIRVGAAQFAHGGGGFALHGASGKGGTVVYHKGRGSVTFFDADGTVLKQVAPERPTVPEP